MSPHGQLLYDGCLWLLHACCSELPYLASQQASEQGLVRASVEGKLASLQSLGAPLSWKGAGLMVSLLLDWPSGGLSPVSELSMEPGQISCLSAGWADEQRMIQTEGIREEDPGHVILAQLWVDPGWQSPGEGQTHCWLHEGCPETWITDGYPPADALLAVSGLSA